MKDTPFIYVLAAEPSGDSLGAALIAELKALRKDVRLRGIGGPKMAAQGVESLFDITPLSILGVLEGLKSYRTVMRLVRTARDDIMRAAPDAVVLIDSWGFMVRVAEHLKAAGFKGKIIKYVAPQVWAMREGRTKVLAKSVDHLLTLHSFEAPYFEREGLPVTYIGNPVFDTDYRSGDFGKFCERRDWNIAEFSGIRLGVFLGSRPSEVQRLGRPFAQTLQHVSAQSPKPLHIFVPAADAIKDAVTVWATGLNMGNIHLTQSEDFVDVLDGLDMALACSGTVTTQLACAGVPSVVGYKLGGLSYRLAKLMFKADYISIVNLAAGEELLPEFIQERCEAGPLSSQLLSWVNDGEALKALSRRLITQTDKMKAGTERASLNAAKAVFRVLD